MGSQLAVHGLTGWVPEFSCKDRRPRNPRSADGQGHNECLTVGARGFYLCFKQPNQAICVHRHQPRQLSAHTLTTTAGL